MRGVTQTAGDLPTGAWAAALRTVTETIAVEVARPQHKAPRWSDTEWRIAEAVAAMHGVSSVLHDHLRWRGPPRWHDFLERQYAATRTRHARLAVALDAIDGAARREHVAVLPLKGVALHALGLYAAGERPMADLDLLAEARDAEAVARLLVALGHRETASTWKHRVFVEPGETAATVGESARNPVKIELHVAIAERLPVEMVDVTESLWPASRRPGLNDYRSPGALMHHLLLHAAGNMTTRSLRLIQLVDIARLAPHLAAAEWDVFRTRRAWWAWPPLALAVRLGTSAIPPALLEELERHCPLSLRRAARRCTLTDVSLSNPRIEAFPGIEWARSRPDALRYAARRIRPTRAALASRADVAGSDPWRGTADWSALPQWRRALRWIWARPLRIESVYPVRAALQTPAVPDDDRASA